MNPNPLTIGIPNTRLIPPPLPSPTPKLVDASGGVGGERGGIGT